MKKIGQVLIYELEYLLKSRAAWLILLGYTLIAVIISLFDDLRISYFSMIQESSILLLYFVAPFPLAAIHIATLSPLFVGGEDERNNQIPITCLIGRKGRSIAKLISAELFSIVMCMMFLLLTLIITTVFGEFDGNAIITNLDGEMLPPPFWNTWQHFGLATASMLSGCMVLTLVTLYISSCSKTLLNAISVTGFLVIFEIVFSMFSFWDVLKEYNIWVLFKPYYFFGMNTLHFSPLINLVVLLLSFTPIIAFTIIGAVKKGE